MQLTQRATAPTDLQDHLGLTVTELPNADATALLGEAFDGLYIRFNQNALFFDAANTKKQAEQKQMEIHMAVYFYYNEYAPRKLLSDFETYSVPVGADVDFGSFSVSEKGGGKMELLQWYEKNAAVSFGMAEKKLNTLLLGETTPEVSTNFK